MIYITSQQDITYFHWQIETYLTNFNDIGIDLHDCYVIMLYNGSLSVKAIELSNKYEANFHFYPIPNKCFEYIAAAKPYGIMKFIEETGYNGSMFLHDSDIVIQKKIDLDDLVNDNCYMGATLQVDEKDYVALSYLKEFDGIVEGLSNIVGVEPKEIGGGAQYVINGLGYDYWKKVYEDCFTIYEFLRKSNTKVQIWCAEMWSVLWNMWHFEKQTYVDERLNHCMRRDPIAKVKNIIHNAGDLQGISFDKLKYYDNYPPFNLVTNGLYCDSLYYDYYKKIRYIRLKDSNMENKIKFIKEGVYDAKTQKEFSLLEHYDLGEERNAEAVERGLAIYVDAPCIDCGGKKKVTPTQEKKEVKKTAKKK